MRRKPTEPSRIQFFLRSIGDVRLERRSADGGVTTVLAAGKPFALLLYLALAPNKSASRKELLDLLWPNAESYRARATLRQTLSTLRDVLGDDSVESRNDDLVLLAEIDVDTRTFLVAVRERRFEDAVTMYARPFLTGFSVAGSDGFDEWASLQRRRLNDAYLFAVESLARARLDAGRLHDALPLAQQLRDANRFRQDSWRLLIEVLLSIGNAVDARIESDAFERFLLDEGCAQETASRTMIARARHLSTIESTPNGAPNDHTVEREPEFSKLMELWAIAESGRAQIAALVGPAQTGKTRLLASAERRLRAKGVLALAFRSRDQKRRRPGALAATVAERLAAARGAMAVSQESARRLVALVPRLSATFKVPQYELSSNRDETDYTADALLELVRAVADEQALALLIDDLHKADAWSREILNSIGDRLDRDRTFLIVASRPCDRTPLDSPRTTVFELRPLPNRQVGIERSSIRSRRAALWTAMAGAIALCACGFALRPRPARLVLAVSPLVGDQAVGLVPVPVVKVQDQFGRIMTSASETIFVKVVSGRATLGGATSRVTRDGKARFEDVMMVGGTDATVLEFSARRLTPARVALSGSREVAALFLVRANLDGQTLSPSSRTLRVSGGDSIVGTALLRYNSKWPAASVMLGVVPTWGDHHTNFRTLSSLITPVLGQLQRVDVHLAAPTSPGCYHLIFAFQAEGNVAEVASGTNWTVGRPLWYHGNDIASWNDAQLATADSTGQVNSGYLRLVNGRLVHGDHGVGATTIHVDVRRTGQRTSNCGGAGLSYQGTARTTGPADE